MRRKKETIKLEAIRLTRESEWRNQERGLAREQRGSTVRGAEG